MVKKIHTRNKRMMAVATTFSHKRFLSSIPKKKGARTFSTKKQAEEYAKENNIKEGSYTIVPAKKDKRFKIEKN